MSNILITGASGAGGSYLAEYVEQNHPFVNLYGIRRWQSHNNRTSNLQNVKNIQILECDLLDFPSILRVLKKAKPDKIFHLAAHADIKKSFDTPLLVVHNNIMSTANLLEAIRLECPTTKLIHCSTSEVYGESIYSPIDELHQLKPVNQYSVSKLAQESLAYSYYKCWNIPVVITRMFTYINPRRTDLFASAFAKQIVEIEYGARNLLNYGNLDSVRSIIDVRDVAAAYWLASEMCDVGEPYNMGGIEPISVKEVLNKLISKCRKQSFMTQQNESLLRPTDITNQVPNVQKFVSKTGWEAKYTLDESLEFLLDYYRNNLDR